MSKFLELEDQELRVLKKLSLNHIIYQQELLKQRQDMIQRLELFKKLQLPVISHKGFYWNMEKIWAKYKYQRDYYNY